MRPNAAGRAVLNVDGRAYADLVAFAVGMQRMECRCLHQPDHVGSGIDRRKLGMMRRQRLLELDYLFGLASGANRNRFH